MPRDWEAVFETWTKPSSDTECEKQENAVRMIRAAISAYEPLANRDIKIIPQGSYRNNTNVRQESDVNVCVCCMEPFFFDYSSVDYGPAESNVVVGITYTYSQFKDDVGVALTEMFDEAGVHRGGKAFDVHANTYRVHADVVPGFAHWRYLDKVAGLYGYTYPWIEPEGTQFYPDGKNEPIVNWPEQHYSNGVTKNLATGYRFKKAVRALKNLKYDMEASGDDQQKKAAKEAPSYLVECLMYNVPEFIGDSPRDHVRNAIVHCYHATQADENCEAWLEVNELKWLFHATQPWTRAQANNFLLYAWQYGEFS